MLMLPDPELCYFQFFMLPIPDGRYEADDGKVLPEVLSDIQNKAPGHPGFHERI